MVLGVYLQVISEVCLPQEDTVAILVRTAELLRVPVCLSVLAQLLLARKTLVATLYGEEARGIK